MKKYVVLDRETRQTIAIINQEERHILGGRTSEGRAPRYGSHGEPIFDAKLIEAHKKRDFVYIALVDASIIRAMLRRKVSNTLPIAEDNRTIRRAELSTATRSGWYYELNERHCYAFRTTEASAQEHNSRHFARIKRNMHVKVVAEVGTVSSNFPVAPKPATVIPFPSQREALAPDVAQAA